MKITVFGSKLKKKLILKKKLSKKLKLMEKLQCKILFKIFNQYFHISQSIQKL